MNRPPASHGLRNPEVEYEPRDVPQRPIFRFIVFFLATLAVLFVLVALLLLGPGGIARIFATPIFRQTTLLANPPARPVLEAKPAARLEALRRNEEMQMRSFAWVDSTRGIIRIPIDRAMEIVAGEGLPARRLPPPGPEWFDPQTSSGRMGRGAP